MKNQKLKSLSILYFLYPILFLVFWLHSHISLDPDFGWHLKMGELIARSGIPKTDPFSYTMPSFPFVDHEWLTNLLIAKLYPSIGLLGLSAISALLITATLLVIFPKKLGEWSRAPLILAAAVIFPFSGVRTQVLTWFFLALLLRVLFDENLWKKFKYFLPFLFLLWANMHAGFAAGIVALFVVNLVGLLRSRTTIVDWMISLVSLGATFINPYGPRLWGEVWMQISDTNLHSAIAEWTPGVFYLDMAFLVLVTFSWTLLIYRLRHKNFQPLKQIVIFAGLFAAVLSADRQIPLWTLSAAPLLALFFQDFYQSLKNDNFASKTFKKCYFGLEILVFLLLLINLDLGFHNDLNFTENNFYPAAAIKFLKSHPRGGHLFSSYNWGGYLIWKYPEKKVFVDGRLPSWRRNYAPPGESKWAFKDYQNILTGKADINQTFAKYHITEVLWNAPPAPPNDLAGRIRGKYNEIINSLFPEKPEISFTQKLEKLGWKKIYQDKISVIYEKS